MSLLALGTRHPELLPLLLLALLPIILHLLDRRRARLVDWPAMRFLVLGSRARIRRWRIREALLILVRSLVALLIALVVIGPVSRETRSVRKLPEGTRGVVIVLDTSFSMTLRPEDSGLSRLELAREGALGLLDTLGSGDAIALVAGQGGAGSLEMRLSDVELARSVVRDVHPGGGHFRLVAALDRAADLLASLGTPHREVYIFTDLQESAVPEQETDRWDFIRKRLHAGGVSPAVRIVDCGAELSSNRFLESLAPPSLAPGTDEPTTFRVGVGSVGTTPTGDGNTVVARLVADGLEVSSSGINVTSPDTFELAHRFRQEGRIRLSVHLPPDEMSIDDTRYLAVDVLGRINVLVVGPSARDPHRGTLPSRAGMTTADYVDLALAPRAPGLAEPLVIFRSELVERLGSRDLDSYRLIVLAAPRRITADVATALQVFVRGGGGLLVFLDDDLDFSSWSELLYRGGSGLLPARPVPGTGSAPEGLHPASVLLTHPALSLFSGGEEGDLAAIRIRRWRRLGKVAPDSTVLARVDAASPWILEKRSGKGRTLLVTTSATPGDSDLPGTPLFVPLIHRLARYLAASNPGTASALVGDEISLPLPGGIAGGQALVIGPDGQELPLTPRVIDGELRAVFGDTRVPGFYELRPARPDRSRSRLFAINVAPEESRLTRVSEEVLETITSVQGLEVVRHAALTPGNMVIVETPVDHRPAVLGLVLVLALVEILLAGRFARGG